MLGWSFNGSDISCHPPGSETSSLATQVSWFKEPTFWEQEKLMKPWSSKKRESQPPPTLPPSHHLRTPLGTFIFLFFPTSHSLLLQFECSFVTGGTPRSQHHAWGIAIYKRGLGNWLLVPGHHGAHLVAPSFKKEATVTVGNWPLEPPLL